MRFRFRIDIEWWLLALLIVLSPVIAVFWLVTEAFYTLMYLLAFTCQVAEGTSPREAHRWAKDDIASMRAGSRYGGM